MSSPSKIHQDNLLTSAQIQFTPLNYEKYEDLMEQFTAEQIIDFIRSRALQYKRSLLVSVSEDTSCIYWYLTSYGIG